MCILHIFNAMLHLHIHVIIILINMEKEYELVKIYF